MIDLAYAALWDRFEARLLAQVAAGAAVDIEAAHADLDAAIWEDAEPMTEEEAKGQALRESLGLHVGR